MGCLNFRRNFDPSVSFSLKGKCEPVGPRVLFVVPFIESQFPFPPTTRASLVCRRHGRFSPPPFPPGPAGRFHPFNGPLNGQEAVGYRPCPHQTHSDELGWKRLFFPSTKGYVFPPCK